MATMYLSGDTKLWWRTRYEDVLEGRCEINAWEELNRKLKERSSSSAWERCTARTRVPDADRHCSRKSKQTMGDWPELSTKKDFDSKALRHQKEGYFTMNGNIWIETNATGVNYQKRLDHKLSLAGLKVEGMRRIFETTLEPSHGFRPNCPWYGKNGMERQKNDSMRRRESSIDRSILAYFDLERNDSLVWEPPFTHYSSPLKRAIENIDNLNKNAEVSVSQSSPPFLANPIFHLELVKAKNLMNRRKGDLKDTRTTWL